MTALAAPRFEVGIRDAKTGQAQNREWSRAELEQATAWLKRMNAKGNDVYIRPAGDHGLVLLDDLKPQALARMKRDGFAPAATIETSPGNYQAWVKLSDKPLAADVRRTASQDLAKQYGGNPDNRYGRLAGFTNQQPQHTRSGRQPYVLAHECPGKAAEGATRLVNEVGDRLDRVAAENERNRRIEALAGYRSSGYGYRSPEHEYQSQAQRLIQRYGKDADYAQMDWMIATDMAKSGRYDAADIAGAIEKHSPQVDGRKAGRIEGYAKRTAEKAWVAPEVQAHRKEQEQEAKRSRGHSPSR